MVRFSFSYSYFLFPTCFRPSITCSCPSIPAPVAVDSLKEKIRELKISFSEDISWSDKHNVQKGKELIFEPFSGKKTPAIQTMVCDNQGSAWLKSSQTVDNANYIVLSDDETEKISPVGLVSATSSDQYKHIDSSRMSKDNLESFQSRVSLENIEFSSIKSANSVVGCNTMSSQSESAICESTISLISLKDIDSDKGASYSSSTSGTVSSLKKVKSSAQDKRLSDQKTFSPELEKDDAFIKELIREDDGILERALDKSRRPKLLHTKQGLSVPRRQVMQLQLPTQNKSGAFNRQELGVRRLKPPKLDDWYKPILELDYFNIVGLNPGIEDWKSLTKLKEIPLCFQSSSHYVEIFRPLVMEEFKAQLHSSFIESSAEDMCCNSLSIVSVERVDDFHIIRGCLDVTESVASKGCTENDLVLLTKEPLQNAAQHVHVLGKVFFWYAALLISIYLIGH